MVNLGKLVGRHESDETKPTLPEWQSAWRMDEAVGRPGDETKPLGARWRGRASETKPFFVASSSLPMPRKHGGGKRHRQWAFTRRTKRSHSSSHLHSRG